MAEKTVASRQKAQSPQTMEETRSQKRYITPPVDIYENADGLMVMADLPGVAKDALDIRVENNVLTIQGTPHYEAPAEHVRREFELVNFFRQFELSDQVDRTKISAELKHGVLALHLPKAEEAKPKRIDVKIS